jgi:hypothetical protein
VVCPACLDPSMSLSTLGSAALAARLECGPATPSAVPEVVEWVVEELSLWRAALTLLTIPDMMMVWYEDEIGVVLMEML